MSARPLSSSRHRQSAAGVSWREIAGENRGTAESDWVLRRAEGLISARLGVISGDLAHGAMKGWAPHSGEQPLRRRRLFTARRT